MKPLLIVGGVLLAITPFATGGRDPVWVLVTAAALLIATIFTATRLNPKTLASRPLIWAIGLYLGWGTLSLTWSINRYQTQIWLLTALLALVAAGVTATLSHQRRQLLIQGYIWLAALTSAVGILLYLTGDYERLTSTFYWANPAAGYLLPALIISGYQWLQNRRYSEGIFTAVIATAFLLTDSRGALLVLAVILAAGLLAQPSLRRTWKPLLAMALIAVALAAGLWQLKAHYAPAQAIAPGSRYAEAAVGEQSSLRLRLDYWTSSIAQWWHHPFIGTGAGTYASAHPQYQQRAITATTDAHNYYLQTFTELGVIGGCLLLWLLAIALFGVWRGAFKHPPSAIWAVALGALLMHLALDVDARYPANAILAAVLLAAVYQPARVSKVGTGRNWLLPGLALVALVMAASNYLTTAQYNRGKIYDENHQLSEASQSYGRAHRGLIFNPDAYTAEGIDYYVLAAITGGNPQQTARSKALAQQAIDADPQDGQHYFLMARALRMEGKLNEAEAAYRQALAKDQWNHPEYYLDLASLQIQMGDRSGSQATIKQALVLYPPSTVANRSADSGFSLYVAQLKVLQSQLEAQ